MDFGSITATISSIKTAGDIVNSILELKTSDAINAAVREANSYLLTVQREALAAQSEQFAMIEEIRNLKEKITNLKEWKSEQKRYKLTSLCSITGAVSYALKESMAAGEPPHYLCTNCYQNGVKSILNPQKNRNSRIMFVCPECRSEAHTSSSRLTPKYHEEKIK